MPKKANQKEKKKNNFRKLDSHHVSFLVLLFLMVSISSYAVFVFMDSIGKYVDVMQASVVGVDGELSVKRPVVESRENPFTDLDITDDSSIAILELYYLEY